MVEVQEVLRAWLSGAGARPLWRMSPIARLRSVAIMRGFGPVRTREESSRRPAQALACHLAAALIRALTGAEGTDTSVRAAATDLRQFDADANPPTDVPDLCNRVADIPGTDLARLIAAFAPDPATRRPGTPRPHRPDPGSDTAR